MVDEATEPYGVPPAEAGRIALPATLGRYQLLSEIAAGGVAVVYLARVIGRGGFERLVAVKVLHEHLARDRQIVAMFLDEARLAARIHHPNVVAVHDVDVLDGRLVLAMDYVEGSSLHALFEGARARGEKLPVGLVVAVVRDALRGLHQAHELTDARGKALGLVHRDVTPHNILVGVDGVARVSDFGIAKARGRIGVTRDHAVVKGKLRYLAPEQVQRGPVDRRLDVFTAGIVLWEGLTGEPLFGGGSEAETIAHVLTGPVAPPSARCSELPAALDAACMRALAREPDGRFATAAEMSEALASVPELSREAIGAEVRALAGERLAAIRAAVELADETADPPSLPSAAALEHEPAAPSVARSVPPEGARAMRMGAVALLLLAAVALGWRMLGVRGQPSAARAAGPQASVSAALVAPAPSVASATPSASSPPLAPASASAVRAPVRRPPFYMPKEL